MHEISEIDVDELALSGSFTVGGLTIAHVSDGVEVAPRQTWFHGVAPELWLPAVGAPSVDHRFPVTYGCFAIIGDGPVTLVDSGWGERARDRDGIRSGGRMLERLAELGVDRHDVGRVLQTHLHSDHCGSLMTGDDPTFPNADVYVSSRELEWWMGPESKASSMAEFTQSRMEPLIVAGRVRTFEGDRRVTDSVTMLATPGHTAGHCAVSVTSGDECALLLGDVIHHPVHLEQHGWLKKMDIDPAESVRSRRRMASLAAERNAIVTAPHLPILTLGRVEHLGEDRFRYRRVEVRADGRVER
ncbi:MBL fold metallo-hydrolase [Streptomyces sp. SID8361]|uniref:MBL fold metallo-hydrolase n=1 Tax=Streptomyces sp. MnatMP-M27 TaxID=1839768 RepID=UPI00081E9624|nr:MBL fold metallo-hydrolase [Streptomyces sp. MnatMP-M27]MYU11164.1 MBL fold metallo-hydrolase [Streptomyces sp. SID8361]SCF78850.1 Glyoxylase, beta-lactamase superfamily II [Streptomyces sp. MnatMP-M27]